MTPNLMDRLATAKIQTLYQLRHQLQEASMNEWILILNSAHPWVKVRMLYRLKDKYDAILTHYFPGCGHQHYFDNVCFSLVDLHKLDTTFLSLCYYLENLAAQSQFDERRRKVFRRLMLREFTKRTYHLEPLPRRKKPHLALLEYVGLNPFIDWHRRTQEITPRIGSAFKPPDLSGAKLQRLLWVAETKRINPDAFLFLQAMAMYHPGQLLNFLS